MKTELEQIASQSDENDTITAIANIINESGSEWFVISDIDDTLVLSLPLLIESLNQKLIQLSPEWQPLSIEELATVPSGRVDDSRAGELLRSLGLSFEEVWTEICTNPQLNENLPLQPGVIEFIETMNELGIPVAGYLTARPREVYPATKTNIDLHGLPQAPIFGPGTNICDVAEAKNLLLQELTSHLTPNTKVIYLDDHIPTAITIKENFGENAIVLVVANNPRGELEPMLLEKQIYYGTLETHIKRLKEQFGV